MQSMDQSSVIQIEDDYNTFKTKNKMFDRLLSFGFMIMAYFFLVVIYMLIVNRSAPIKRSDIEVRQEPPLRLDNLYDSVSLLISLYTHNGIFATLKDDKGYDLAQFLTMGAENCIAIRKQLNENLIKFLREGDPADPLLSRLKREMDEINRFFDLLEVYYKKPKLY
ncbi:uncharacterized protein LOC114119066 [Aphis gossypii]|uniref:uncharacterized protein LOC114119066 n=1 Tax=Aphis gossypii TaxID=80765 RepID=UPI0021596AD9|nr:uncharacterized protein LOC114119066 [Aphis gossypii]